MNKHRTMLLQILKEIYTDISLGPIFGFKGGTAAYFFHDLSRFSVDLDFDLLDEKRKDYVFKSLELILKSFGDIKEKYEKRNTIIFIMSYSPKVQNIKLEISKRNFGSSYELKNYLGIPMLVMVKEDMFAHKLAAMLERGKIANRDIFDVWFFLKNNWPINNRIIKLRTDLCLNKYLKKCISFIEKVPQRGILSGMGELLNEKQKVFVKTKLKDDLLFLLKIKEDAS